MLYNWQQKDWPNFRFDSNHINDLLFDYAQKAGRVAGLLEGLTKEQRDHAIIDMMLAEAIKTSEIEGEYLSRKDVMSSIKKNLGFAVGDKVSSPKAEGAASLMTAVRETFDHPLNSETLFAWHQMIMKGTSGFNTGQWRTHTEPMQVISGSIGKEKVHFEAPPSKTVPSEMLRFMDWFNQQAPKDKADGFKSPIRAAVAHLYFESIHPFEDGNGRIGRAISEKALSQGLGYPVFLSLSNTIESNKQVYYQSLMEAQRGIEITDWVYYFVDLVVQAQTEAASQIEFSLKKTRFFDRHRGSLNPRQEKALGKMLLYGKEFKGGMTAKKFMSINKVSKATATRDLQDLVSHGILIPQEEGRNRRYEVNFE